MEVEGGNPWMFRSTASELSFQRAAGILGWTKDAALMNANGMLCLCKSSLPFLLTACFIFPPFYFALGHTFTLISLDSHLKAADVLLRDT